MGAYLMTSHRILGSNFLSATNQAGVRPLAAVAYTGNVGGLAFSPLGTPTAAINERLDLIAAGDLKTATFRDSVDGGTNWLGRKVDTTWDGNGATERTVLADTASAYPSRPVAIDFDGDGILDRVLVAVNRDGASQIDILYTTNLTGAGSWSTLASDATGAILPTVSTQPVLLSHGGDVFLFFTSASGTQVVKSTDGGVTWGTAVTVEASTVAYDAVSLASGKMLVVYLKSTGGFAHIFCTSSADGATWSAASKQVTAAGSVDYAGASVVQEADGKTVVFTQRSTATAAIQARQTTAVDPAASSATWAAYSETLWSGETDNSDPTACIAPDGTIYAAWYDSGDGEVEYSKFKDGDANYSAAATLYNPANTIAGARLGNIGGAIWCVMFDGTANDVVMVLTRYWTTYDASTAPASWTGTEAQFLHDGLWVTPGGADGQIGDYWDIDSTYDYGGDRCVMLAPSRPTRSTADGADWNTTFDLGASRYVPVGTICVIANVKEAKFQMDSTSTFTPDKATTISFVEQTIASASVGWGNGFVTQNATTFAAHSQAGKRVRAGTSGQVALIKDNGVYAMHCDTDMSAWTGDLQILSDRAWANQSGGFYYYRYIRLLIENQQTAEDYYEVKALAAGVTVSVPTGYSVQVDYGLAATDTELRSGTITRRVDGTRRRRFELDLNAMTTSERDTIVGMITNNAGRPLVFIPDSSNYYDFAIVQPVLNIQARLPMTQLVLVEVI